MASNTSTNNSTTTTTTTATKYLLPASLKYFTKILYTLFCYKRSFEPSSAKFGFKSDIILLNVICVFSLGRNRCVIIGNALTIFKIEQKER